MKINKHGLIIKNLRKVAGELQANLSKSNTYYSGIYMQVDYNVETGELIAAYHYSLGHNNWTVYHDKNFVRIGNYIKPCTMQELVTDIINQLIDNKQMENYAGDTSRLWYGNATKGYFNKGV